MSSKGFRITISIMTVVIAVLIFLNIQEDNRKTWDTCYPMANVNITWRQTFHSGAWSE